MRKSKVISLTLLLSLLVSALMACSLLSVAAQIEDYKKVILETAQSLQLDGTLDVWESEEMSEVTYLQSIIEGETSVVIQCMVYGTEEVRDAILALGAAMAEAAEEMYDNVPATNTETHTIQGITVIEQDTPAYLYETVMYSVEMPQVRSMYVELSPLASCAVSTYGGPDPKPYMVALLEHLQDADLLPGEGGGIPAPDSDGDGVSDDIDQCPDTPVGAAVDDKGCPAGA